jgi:HAE1 family hydrophobic/amphiphilic exporter-1
LRNPLAGGLIAVVTAIFGLYAYLTLSLSIVPNITQPTAILTATDPGANPSTIETQVTRPIEDAMASLENIKMLTSTSAQGLSVVNVGFTSNVSTDLLSVDVMRAISAFRGQLPAAASQPGVAKLDTNSALPILKVALSGAQSLDQLEQVVENQVQRAFQSVDGVGSVSLSGGRREIWVEVDPFRLREYGLGLNTSSKHCSSVICRSPRFTGRSRHERERSLEQPWNRAAELGDLVVAELPVATGAGGQSNQVPVHLRDLATISNTHATTTTIDRYNGVTAVTLSRYEARRRKHHRSLDGIRKQIAALEPVMPPGMHLNVVTDLATYPQQSLNTIQRMLIEAVLLTGLILLVFMHTRGRTLIVLSVIPTSVLTTFGLMDLPGLNLNLFSMLALTLSIGTLVDDGIVVIENISRHLGLE